MILFVEDENIIEAIELKTVRPNAGEMRGEKSKILHAKAALKYNSLKKEIYFYIGFPFDPTNTNPTGSDKQSFISINVEFEKYFDESEILLGPELWNHLSGSRGTMEEILKIINSIATPQFKEFYELVRKRHNYIKNQELYKQVLSEWFLFREIGIVNNWKTILENAIKQGDEKLVRRTYNRVVFDSKYNYQTDNVYLLEKYLS